MTRAGCVRRMIGDAFVAQRVAVVIDPCPHHAGAHGDIVHRLKVRDQRCNVSVHRCTVDVPTIYRRATTPMGGLLHQENLCTGLTRCLGRLQAGNTATYNNHIHKSVEMLVGVGVTVFGHLAETRRLAHDGFKDVFPRGTRRHEGFIVEPRRQEARDIVVGHAHVELEAGPVVLRRTGQAIKQFGRGGALVGLKLAALAHVDQGVRFFRTAGHRTTGAVIFERPTHHHLVIGEQGAGECVALIACELLAVKCEMQLFVFVQQTTSVYQTTCVGEARAHANSLQVQPG